MTVEQSDVVDIIGIDGATGSVVLWISDHLDWDDGYGHLLILQSKINTYLRYIESGEINEWYPQAVGKDLVIEIVGKYDLPDTAANFFREAGVLVSNAGVSLRFRKLQED